jgi:hypothetical protein
VTKDTQVQNLPRTMKVCAILLLGVALAYTTGSVHQSNVPPSAPRLAVSSSAGILYPGKKEAVLYHITNKSTARVVVYSITANTRLGATIRGDLVPSCDPAHSGVAVRNHGPMFVRDKAVPFVTLAPEQSVTVAYHQALSMAKSSPLSCAGSSFLLTSVRVNAV